MGRSGICRAAILVAVVIFPLAATAQDERFQSFESPPANWTTVTSPVFPNAVGYSLAANAGGAVGEVGGRFFRANTPVYCADLDIGTLSFEESFTASGKLDSPAVSQPNLGQGFHVGYFNLPVGAAGGLPSVSLVFNDDPFGGLAWDIRVILGPTSAFPGGHTLGTGFTSLGTNVDRLWSLDYDATGGIGGAGRFTAVLSGPLGGGTKFVDLTTDDRQSNHPLSVFGIFAPPSSGENPDRWGDLFIDDVTYSFEFDPIPGDANGDGCVSGADFTIWNDNFDNGTGPGGKTWREGDWTGEGYVTGADFTIWSDQFGEGCAPASSVPEPPALRLVFAMFAVGALFTWRGRRAIVD